jgi:tight adherence protein C
MSAAFAGLTVFFLLAAAATAVYGAFFGTRRAFDERIAEMAVKMRVSYGALSSMELDSDKFARTLFRWISHQLPRSDGGDRRDVRISRVLVQAGYGSRGALATFHAARLGATVLFGLMALVGALALDIGGALSVVAMISGIALGATLPAMIVGRRARDRADIIGGELSDVLDLLVVCVEAGLGLSEAIKIVGTETERQKQQIGVELACVSTEINAGASMGQALRGLAERTGVDTMKPLAATLIQSEQLGSQVAPALKAISDTLRTNRRLAAEEAAQKTTVKILFPLVLFILPAMMAVIVGPAMIIVMRTLAH